MWVSENAFFICILRRASACRHKEATTAPTIFQMVFVVVAGNRIRWRAIVSFSRTCNDYLFWTEQSCVRVSVALYHLSVRHPLYITKHRTTCATCLAREVLTFHVCVLFPFASQWANTFTWWKHYTQSKRTPPAHTQHTYVGREWNGFVSDSPSEQ